MPENFSFNLHNQINVNSVRNFLVQADNEKNRRNYPLLFHILYALACALVIYLAVDTSSSFVKFICLCLAPGMCVFNYLYSPMLLKLSATFIPPVVFIIRTLAANPGAGFLELCPPLFTYVLCILTAAALTKVSISGFTKSTCFIITTVIYALVTLCICAFFLVSLKGSCSPKTAISVLDEFFDSYTQETMNYARSEEGLGQIMMMLPPESDISEEKLLSAFEETLTLSAAAAKSSLPSAFVLSCMFFAFVTIELFSLFAKFFRIDVFVCIMDKFWTYRLSRETTMMYDIVFFMYILGMFLPLPEVLNTAVLNLLLIMTPVMVIPGTKSIYGFFRKKKWSKSACLIISFLIIFALVMIFGMIGVYIICSIGVTYVMTREMQESMLIPAKLIADDETYKRLYGDEKKQEENINEPDNTKQ